MSNLLSAANLATALGVNKAIICLAKKAGHISPNEDKLYDILDSKNKFWIDGQISKGKIFDISRILNKKFEPKKTKVVESVIIPENISPPPIESKKRNRKQSSVDTDDIDDNSGLYDAKLKLEIKKLKNQDKLETLKIAKIEGELLPVDAVSSVFLWAVADMKKTFEQEVDNIANIYIKVLDGKHEQYIKIKQELMKVISHIGNTYKENLMNGIDNAISEYSEVRGRGERQ